MHSPGQFPGLPPYGQEPRGELQNAAPPYGLTHTHHAEIQARIDAHNKQSFVLGVPGLMLQFAGNFLGVFFGMTVSTFVAFAGMVLLVIGLSHYARSRGQSGWLGFVGLLSCLGLIILSLLPKKCLACGGPVAQARCQRCGAPGAK